MIFFSVLFSIATIVALCWLLFTLAVFALPLLVGFTACLWAYNSGAGWLGAVVAGMLVAVVTLGIWQFLFIAVRPFWARFVIAAIFVAPAIIAGYRATHGILKHAMPSETWQIVFSVIGAAAVGVTALMRVARAGSMPSDRRLARS